MDSDRHRRRVLEELALPGVERVRFAPTPCWRPCERLGVESLVLKQLIPSRRPAAGPFWQSGITGRYLAPSETPEQA